MEKRSSLSNKCSQNALWTAAKSCKNNHVIDHGLKREMHECRNQQIIGDQAGKSAYRFVF